MIDVGSSGSRVRVYHWPARTINHQIPQHIKQISKKKRVAFSSHADDLSQIEGYVIELIDMAKEFVPENYRKDTPIYFLATAGMRLITEAAADAMMEKADCVLRDNEVNPFLYSSHNTRILSGEEEGAFQWITVNYLRGYFLPNQGSSQDDQVGIMEMGGASTQIAFIPEVSSLAGKFPVTLWGVRYPLYVHSYLGYGQEAVERWIAAAIAEDSNNVLEEKDNVKYINSPCALQGDSILVEGEAGLMYNCSGTGQPAQCELLISQMLYQVDPSLCQPAPCAIGPFYQPSIPDSMSFYAVDAFFYPANVFGILHREDNVLTPLEYGDAAREYCVKHVSAASHQSAANTNSTYKLSARCMMGLYAEKLFTQAYGFHNQTQQIHIKDEVEGNELSWCLGALLYEMGDDRFTSSSPRHIPHSLFICFILLSLQLLCVTFCNYY